MKMGVVSFLLVIFFFRHIACHPPHFSVAFSGYPVYCSLLIEQGN